VTDLIGL